MYSDEVLEKPTTERKGGEGGRGEKRKQARKEGRGKERKALFGPRTEN